MFSEKILDHIRLHFSGEKVVNFQRFLKIYFQDTFKTLRNDMLTACWPVRMHHSSKAPFYTVILQLLLGSLLCLNP